MEIYKRPGINIEYRRFVGLSGMCRILIKREKCKMKVLVTAAAVSVMFVSGASAQMSGLSTAAELGKSAVSATDLENASALAGKAFDVQKPGVGHNGNHGIGSPWNHPNYPSHPIIPPVVVPPPPPPSHPTNPPPPVVVNPGHGHNHGYYPGYGYPYNDPYYNHPYYPDNSYGYSAPLSKDGQVALGTVVSVAAGIGIAMLLAGPVGIVFGIAVAIGGSYLAWKLVKGQE